MDERKKINGALNLVRLKNWQGPDVMEQSVEVDRMVKVLQSSKQATQIAKCEQSGSIKRACVAPGDNAPQRREK